MTNMNTNVLNAKQDTYTIKENSQNYIKMSQQLQYCNKCGNVKLEYIDFTLNTKNRLVCCYCDNIPPTQCINANMFLPSQNKINPWSPVEKQQESEIIHVEPEPE